jgi:hypothetical protein
MEERIREVQARAAFAAEDESVASSEAASEQLFNRKRGRPKKKIASSNEFVYGGGGGGEEGEGGNSSKGNLEDDLEYSSGTEFALFILHTIIFFKVLDFHSTLRVVI